MCSDYGYAKPGEDLSGLCVKDPDVELEDPCDNEGTSTYIASTGSVCDIQCLVVMNLLPAELSWWLRVLRVRIPPKELF